MKTSLKCTFLFGKMQQCHVGKAEMLGIGRKENFIANHVLVCIATFSLWEVLGDSLFLPSETLFWFIERLCRVQSPIPYCAHLVYDLV